MSSTKKTQKTLKSVDKLKIRRKSKVFTAEWGKVDANKNSAEKLVVKWYFDKGDSNGKNWVLFKSATLGKTATTSTLDLSKLKDKSHDDYTDFYPYTSASKAGNDAAAIKKQTLNKVKCVVYSVKGSTSVSTSTIYDFAKPPAPKVSVSYDDNDQVTCSVDIDEDYLLKKDDNNALARVAYRVLKQSQGSSAPSVRKGWAWHSPSDFNKYRERADASPLSGVKYTIEAYAAGPGGKSPIASASKVIAVPNRPRVTGAARDGQGRYRVCFNTCADAWHPVDAVRVQYQDVPFATSLAEDAWADAIDHDFGSNNTSALTDPLPQLAAGCERHFRVTSKYLQLSLSVSEPYYAEAAAPENIVSSASDITVGLEGRNPYIVWNVQNEPAAIRGSVVVYVFRNDEKTEITPGNRGIGLDDLDMFDEGVLVSDVSGMRYGVAAGFRDSRGAVMRSPIVWSNPIPSIPTGLSATPSDEFDSALLEWTNPKGEFDGVEVAWSEHRDAWASNEQPDTQAFNNPSMQSARIFGLEAGKSYWFYVRTFDNRGDSVNYGPWASTSVACSMSSVPDVPVLTLSRSWVLLGAPSMHATWSYSANSNEPLVSTRIVLEDALGEVVRDWGFDDERTEGDLDIEGLPAGDYDAYAIVSNTDGAAESGREHLRVIEAPSVSLSAEAGEGLALQEREDPIEGLAEVEDGEDESPQTLSYTALTRLPLELECSCADPRVEMTLTVKPLVNYALDAPDGRRRAFAGETVFSSPASGSLSIDVASLSKQLLDGCMYRAQLKGVEPDSLMRSEDGAAGSFVDFTVDWAHKAPEPEGSVEISADDSGRIVAAVEVECEDSTCLIDVYRVTPDRILPVAKGLASGSTVVDPYPAYGWDGCAYRIAARTTEDSVSWSDAPYTLGRKTVTIDWDGKQVELPYNIESEDPRRKSYEVRRYADDSKHGWLDGGIDRLPSVKADLMRGKDEDTLALLYELSRFEGICMIRMPDGLAYAAIAEVDFSKSYSKQSIGVTVNVAETDDHDLFMAEEIQ